MNKLTKVKKLQDPGLAEFVFTVAATAPMADKRHLPERFFKKIRTEAGAKKFARMATDEQKKEFLGLMGYRTVTLICKDDSVFSPHLKGVMDQYEETKTPTSLGDQINESTYMISDKRLFERISHLSDIVASPAYKRHMEMLRLKKGQPGWKPRLDNEDAEVLQKREEEIMTYLKIIYSGIDDLLNCQLFCEINPIEFKALLYLFFKKGEYVSYDTLMVEMRGFVNVKATRQIIKELLEGMYVQMHYDPKVQAYSITSRGINTVIAFCERASSSFKLLA